MKAPFAAAALLGVPLLGALGGCASKGELDASGGITAVRSACPAVAIPAGTGDITLFTGAAQTTDALDVTATMTHVRSTCSDAGEDVVTNITFDVLASRTDAAAARDVSLPYFLTVVRGGSAVTAKRIAQLSVHFDAGQTRAQASGTATSYINRAAATLPDDVRKKLTQKRKAGDEDAAVDPLTTPEVRQAVLSASFEALVGFQLTDAQLRYNATR